MAFEQRDLQGSLFKNKRRTKSTHPEYTGQAKLDGVEYWVSAWIKEKQDGEKYFSIAFTAKDDQSGTALANKGGGGGGKGRENTNYGDMDDDIPF